MPTLTLLAQCPSPPLAGLGPPGGSWQCRLVGRQAGWGWLRGWATWGRTAARAASPASRVLTLAIREGYTQESNKLACRDRGGRGLHTFLLSLAEKCCAILSPESSSGRVVGRRSRDPGLALGPIWPSLRQEGCPVEHGNHLGSGNRRMDHGVSEGQKRRT